MAEKTPLQIVTDRLTNAKTRGGHAHAVSSIETDLNDQPTTIKGTVTETGKAAVPVFWNVLGKSVFPQNPMFDLVKTVAVQ